MLSCLNITDFYIYIYRCVYIYCHSHHISWVFRFLRPAHLVPVKIRKMCILLYAQSLTADSPSYLPVTERGVFVAAEMLILIIWSCLYSLPSSVLLLLPLLSQLFTEFDAPNLSIFNFCFLSFLSCLSTIPGEFVLLSWAKGTHCHLPLLTRGEFLHWSLQITCLCTALLFCHCHGNKE